MISLMNHYSSIIVSLLLSFLIFLSSERIFANLHEQNIQTMRLIAIQDTLQIGLKTFSSPLEFLIIGDTLRNRFI